MKHTESINENYMFSRLYRTGKNMVDGNIAVYYKMTKREYNRLGITATKKIGGAVARDRARRVIKEAYRLSEDKLPKGMDIVIVARKKATYVKMGNVRRSLLHLFEAKTQKKNGS